eukprot:IDg840t1
MELRTAEGGKLHLSLNTGGRPIANKYREGKMESTLKRGVFSASCVGMAALALDYAKLGEQLCWDPKDGELCRNRAKPEETLVEARSDADVQIARRIWRMISVFGGVIPSDDSQTLNTQERDGCFVEPLSSENVGPVGHFCADLGGSSKYSSEILEGRSEEGFHANIDWAWVLMGRASGHPRRPARHRKGSRQNRPVTLGKGLALVEWRILKWVSWFWHFAGLSGLKCCSSLGSALNVKVKRFKQARVNSGSNYDSLKHRWELRGANEIPLLLILFYLRRKTARPFYGLFWHQLRFRHIPLRAAASLRSSAPDTFRRGVWLGRHIFYKTTKVSKDELSENRNLTIRQVSDCSPANRERELGLDRRETATGAGIAAKLPFE